MNEDEVCNSCVHNIRTDKRTYVDCNCDLDGHYITYMDGFTSRCKHYEKCEDHKGDK